MLPAATFADGPISGTHITGGLVGGVFPGQPVQGVSALVDAHDGTFLAMPDNGYGTLDNSADFNLARAVVDPARAPIPDGVELVLAEAALEKLLARALGALLREPLVVFVATARIAVAFDRHVFPLGVQLPGLCEPRDQLAARRAHARVIEVEQQAIVEHDAVVALHSCRDLASQPVRRTRVLRDVAYRDDADAFRRKRVRDDDEIALLAAFRRVERARRRHAFAMLIGGIAVAIAAGYALRLGMSNAENRASRVVPGTPRREPTEDRAAAWVRRALREYARSLRAGETGACDSRLPLCPDPLTGLVTF